MFSILIILDYYQKLRSYIGTMIDSFLIVNDLPLPRARTEVLALADDLADSRLSTIKCLANDSSTPVIWHHATRELNAEEENDGAQSKTDVQSGRGDVVVLHPPTTVLVSDVLVEDVADHDP
jgi:hypothetical protein